MPGMWFRGLSVLPKFRIDSNGVVMGEVDVRSSRSDVVMDFLPLPWVRVLSTLRSRGVGPLERSVSLELLRGGVLSSTETELIAASSPWVRFWLVAEASGKLTRRRASANVFGSIGSLPSEPGPWMFCISFRRPNRKLKLLSNVAPMFFKNFSRRLENIAEASLLWCGRGPRHG